MTEITNIDNNVKTHDDSQFSIHDVSVERARIYHYPNGDTFRIEEPRTLYLKIDDNGHSHRVVGKDGWTYYPVRGWIAISWKSPLEEVSF